MYCLLTHPLRIILIVFAALLFIGVISIAVLGTVRAGRVEAGFGSDEEFSFVKIGAGSASIYRHNRTDVVYSISANGILTVLLNPDGGPLLYSEWYED